VLRSRAVLFGSLYQRILGHPFVYEQVRPAVVGRIDMAPLYRRLEGKRHTILDVGCGTGDALRYLTDFDAYVGYDTDPVALRFARNKYGARADVRFEEGLIDAAQIAELRPTAVVLAGLLHHVSDADATSLLRMIQSSPRLEHVVTQDIVYVPNRHVNNAFAYMDRGRFCRDAEGYRALARSAGLRIDAADIVPAHPKNKRVVYFMMTLSPAGV